MLLTTNQRPGVKEVVAVRSLGEHWRSLYSNTATLVSRHW